MQPTRRPSFFGSIAGKFVLFATVVLALGALMLLLTFGVSMHVTEEAARLGLAGRLRAALLTAASHFHFVAANVSHSRTAAHESGARRAMGDYEKELGRYLIADPGAGIEPFPQDHVGLRRQIAQLADAWREHQRPFFENLLKQPATAAESCARCHQMTWGTIAAVESLASSIESNHRVEMERAAKLKSGLVAVFVAVTLLMLFFGWRRIVVPITRLSAVAAELGRGDMDVRAEAGASDEVGVLAGTFNEMAGRVQAQLRDLSRSYENFRSIFEGTSDGIFITGPTGKYLDANPRGLEMLGYTLDELRMLDISAIVCPDDPPPRLDDLRAGRTVAAEFRLRRKDGGNIDSEISARALPDGRLTAIVRDVTERRRSLEHMVHLSSFPQLNPNPIVEVDGLGKVTFANDATLRLLDRAGETGRVEALFPPDLDELLVDLAAGSSSVVEREVVVGGVVVFEHVQLLSARATARIYGVDITGLRSAEKALQDSEERYRTLVDTVPEGISMADPDGVIVTINAAGAELLGYPHPDELVGKRWLELISPAHRAAAAVALGRLAETRTDPGAEFDFVRADGTTFRAAVKAAVVAGSGDKPAGFVGIMRDVTERTRLEEQLRQSQKLDAIGKLAGGVAHDFNNLLSVILSYIGFILDGLPGGSPLRVDAIEIKKAGERAAALTRQLLAFSRKQTIHPRDIAPNDAITGLAKMLTRLIGEQVELGLRLSDGVGDVHLDPSQLEQVIINLAVNARDAMPGGGRLVIETGNAVLDASRLGNSTDAEPGDYVMIAVSDTGVGIPREVLPRIFEPFFTTKEIGKGTGLGLSTVYGIVKQNKGHIDVESEPGRGTTFRLFFRRLQHAGSAGDERRENAPRRQTGKPFSSSRTTPRCAGPSPGCSNRRAMPWSRRQAAKTVWRCTRHGKTGLRL
ncbi:MAG: PAS domain S-box protein [Deltaproteobacteria bacterium]|nr:PAS domain S-box protein [Deltaproteobacteria bacterium]